MAKILTFQSKESGTSDQNFLTDENDKLSFRTAADGAVSLGNMPSTSMPSLPDPKKDWGNQELADLFRVSQLLSGANVPVETLRGVTDEGDPWYVFCHLNGDVFIHMARIDGFYVLDSPNVHRPLRGRDFNALVADFTNSALPTTTAAKDDVTERRVIRLDRGGKVRLHPSAMLAALIWTLFLASEDLVMLAPEEQSVDTDDLLDFADVISTDFDFQAMETETTDIASRTMPEETKVTSEDALQGSPEAYLQMREAMGQGLASQQNNYAMGLSTIAIAMGFMSEAVLHDNQRKVLEGLDQIGLAQYAASAEGGPELEKIVGENGGALLEMLAEFLGFDLSLNTDMAEAPTTTTEGSLLQQDILHATEAAADDQIVLTLTPTAKTVQALARKDEEAELTESASAKTTEEIDVEAYIATASADADEATLTMLDIVNGAVQMEEFQLGQTTIKASFDVTNSAFSLSDYIVVNQRTTEHREFDDNVQAFIDFIQAKETDVGVVKFGNEIIMIDRGAFIEGGVETYSFSWETNEGQIISMIGLKSEFQEFDLIA